MNAQGNAHTTGNYAAFYRGLFVYDDDGPMPELVDLGRRCLNEDPSQRPSFDEVHGRRHMSVADALSCGAMGPFLWCNGACPVVQWCLSCVVMVPLLWCNGALNMNPSPLLRFILRWLSG